MIKNLFSKALLSVVMDKSARDNLETRKKMKSRRKVVDTENAALAARAETADPPPPPAPEAVEDTRQLVLDSLAAAERELKTKRKMTPERQALIQQAMATQKAKAHLLDDLSPEQREKLYVMAMKSFDLDPVAEARMKEGKAQKARKKPGKGDKP